ncbi:MAG: hypothetical protein GC164_15920 [Phycisphaera sp.]|nr:hypothetical protein [Phycisphaera sp.]
MARTPSRTIRASRDHHRRGAAAVLAMMFLVIFGSLAAAMAIVAQGNLSTADSQLKINRSLAAAETGMNWLIYRINLVSRDVQTRAGEIDATKAGELWDEVRAKLLDSSYANSLVNESHNLSEPYEVGKVLHVGPIAVGPGAPQFTATFTPHPITGENYNSSYYQRPPYSTMSPAVSNTNPLDATWVRVRVEAVDGTAGHSVTRSIQMDFKIDKKIRYAILSKSRVMIGQNVMVEGPVGSRFMDTDLTNGHPIQVESDFKGLDSQLDSDLDAFVNTLAINDTDGDNRLNVHNATEVNGITNPQDYDYNGDGYIDDYDFFLSHFDSKGNGDGKLTPIELNTSGDIHAAQLFTLIDTAGDPSRPGYNDGVIDELDGYAKIKGEVKLTASMSDWNNGAAGGQYQNYFQGPIHPDYGEDALTFQASDSTVHQFEPTDFDVSKFEDMTTSDLATQATTEAAKNDPNDPNSPQPLGTTQFEEVPYGSAHPYDYYDRPVYKNMTFKNVKITKGSNALFINCRFIGVTFIQTETANGDSNYNFVGTQEADGSMKFPTLSASVNGASVSNTKTISNNVRFDNCTFEGAVVTSASPNYTHVRNKIAFTGNTKFKIDDSSELTSDQKKLFKRSTILAPHYSVEMGTFVSPSASTETVDLSGTIVVGVLDMRGQVDVNGSIITTFEPKNGEGPVIGDTSPQFNTTLGYFSSSDGDLEAELPTGGMGVIHVRYDPTLPLPDGILGPIQIEPEIDTYTEGGAQ